MNRKIKPSIKNNKIIFERVLEEQTGGQVTEDNIRDMAFYADFFLSAYCRDPALLKALGKEIGIAVDSTVAGLGPSYIANYGPVKKDTKSHLSHLTAKSKQWDKKIKNHVATNYYNKFANIIMKGGDKRIKVLSKKLAEGKKISFSSGTEQINETPAVALPLLPLLPELAAVMGTALTAAAAFFAEYSVAIAAAAGAAGIYVAVDQARRPVPYTPKGYDIAQTAVKDMIAAGIITVAVGLPGQAGVKDVPDAPTLEFPGLEFPKPPKEDFIDWLMRHMKDWWDFRQCASPQWWLPFIAGKVAAPAALLWVAFKRNTMMDLGDMAKKGKQLWKAPPMRASEVADPSLATAKQKALSLGKKVRSHWFCAMWATLGQAVVLEFLNVVVRAGFELFKEASGDAAEITGARHLIAAEYPKEKEAIDAWFEKNYPPAPDIGTILNQWGTYGLKLPLKIGRAFAYLAGIATSEDEFDELKFLGLDTIVKNKEGLVKFENTIIGQILTGIEDKLKKDPSITEEDLVKDFNDNFKIIEKRFPKLKIGEREFFTAANKERFRERVEDLIRQKVRAYKKGKKAAAAAVGQTMQKIADPKAFSRRVKPRVVPTGGPIFVDDEEQ